MTQRSLATRRSERVGSRRFRRALVVGTYGGWLLLAAIVRLLVAAVPPFPEGLFAILSFVPGFLIFIGGRTYLNREVLRGDEGLDERLVLNRNLAFRRAFQVFVYVVIIAWPLSGIVVGLEPGLQGWADAELIFTGTVLLAVTLPAAVWMWREPDPLTTPEEEAA